jgi:hypothetical protein
VATDVATSNCLNLDIWLIVLKAFPSFNSIVMLRLNITLERARTD